VDKFEIKSQRLVSLSMLGCLLFNYPALALFNVQGMLFGIPVLYVYIFVVWALLIVLIAMVVEARE
jgi:hypothetical protein